MLPSSARQKPMVAACKQLVAVLERDRVHGLDARPLVPDLSRCEAAVGALADSAIDPIADLQVGQLLVASVGHEDAGFGTEAVGAGMTASPVGIDRPAKRH